MKMNDDDDDDDDYNNPLKSNTKKIKMQEELRTGKRRESNKGNNYGHRGSNIKNRVAKV